MRSKKPEKRDVFAELSEGVAAVKANRQGNVTLRRHKVAASAASGTLGAEVVSGTKTDSSPATSELRSASRSLKMSLVLL